MIKISRRDVLKKAVAVSSVVPALAFGAESAWASDLKPLSPEESTAKAFGFVTDAAKLDAAANPSFRSGQTCANCSLYQAPASAAVAGCSIFPGRSVPAAGWCKVWSQRAG